MNCSIRKFATMSAAAVAAFGFLLATPALGASSRGPAAPRSASIRAELKAEIAAQLNYNPDGRVINSRQISYDHGYVVVTVVVPGAAPRYTCPNGSVCIFENRNLRGPWAAVSGPLDRNIPISQYIPWVQSLHNKRGHGSIISNGNGRTACYPAGQVANAISPPVQFWPYLFLEHSANCN